MTKRIIALLLALILTVGLLPTVALADAPAADTNVVSGSIGKDGKWTTAVPDQSKMPEGVETVSKTAKKVVGKEKKNGIYKGFFSRWDHLCTRADSSGKNKDVTGTGDGAFGMFRGCAWCIADL